MIPRIISSRFLQQGNQFEIVELRLSTRQLFDFWMSRIQRLIITAIREFLFLCVQKRRQFQRADSESKTSPGEEMKMRSVFTLRGHSN